MKLFRHFFRSSAMALIFFTAWTLGAAPAANPAQIVAPPLTEPTPGAMTNALAQIAGLQAEAAALSPAQKKIATALLQALREKRQLAPRAFAPKVQSNLTPTANGGMLVDINAKVSDDLLAQIRAVGGTVVSSFRQYDAIRAEIPLEAMEAIAGRADVNFIRPADIPLTNVGTATSEGDVSHGANFVRTNYGITGAGVKVGVLSDSVRSLAQSQTNGDLGTVFVFGGQSGVIGTNDTGEGTAMLEIVHDIAPDAQLYFATGDGGEAQFASNIIAMADAGCAVIIDDLTYRVESPFQDDLLAQAVQTVSDRGVLYFSSAANSGNLDHGTSGTWAGDFAPAGVDPRYNFGQVHNWGGTIFNRITTNGSGVTLFWADPFGATTNNYNLYITDSSGNVLRSSVDNNYSTNQPIESVNGATNGEYVVVTLASGAGRFLHLDTGRGCLAIGTSGNTRGHNASGAANAFSVAATSAKGRTNAFVGGTNNPAEYFSSDGYPRIFFQPDGTPITPGNYSSTGGKILAKPDITAADGVIASTTFAPTSGFRPFFGTSAAAPHAGAIAALIKSYRPTFTAAQIRAALTNTALDIEGAGFDRDSGVGIVMADRAIQSVLDSSPPVLTIDIPVNGAIFSNAFLGAFSGTASDPESGIASVTLYLSRSDGAGGYLYWDGTNWTATATALAAAYNSANGSWTAPSGYNFPAGGNLPNGIYQIQVAAQNNLNPAGSTGVGINIDVEVHPTYVWTAGSFTDEDPNNNNNRWDNPANWDVGSVPTSEAIVIIDSGSPDASAGNVNLYRLVINGGNLTIAGMNPRQFYFSGGQLSSGSGPGVVTIPLNGNLYLGGSADKTLGGFVFINNYGTITWTGLGNINFQAASVFNNAGDFEVQNDSLFYFSTGGSPVPVFNNSGTIRKTVATGSTVIRGDNGGIIFNHNGLIDIQTGVLSSQSQFNFNIGGSFSGAGLTRIDGGTGTMYATNTILSGGTVVLAGGQLNGTGAFTGPGNFNWTGGTVNGSVGTATGGNMLISGNGDKTIGGTLNNAGHAVWTGSGNVNIHASAICNNSGTFTAQNDALFYFDTGGTPVPAFNNSGTFIKNTGTNSTTFRVDNGGVTFNNTGTVNAQTGTIALAGGGTDANASFNPSAGALITFPNGGHTFNGGINFTGLGVTRLNGGLIVLGGGTNTVQTNATFEISGGTMAGTGAFNGAGLFSWSGGVISANLTMLSGATLSLNGTDDKVLGSSGTINNLGTAVWTGTGNFFSHVGGVFNNTNLFLIQNDSFFYNDNGGSPNPVFNNYGTLRKIVATNVTTVLANNSPWVFNNSGIFDIQTGVLAFNTGANFNAGGTFSGAGKTQLANAASSLIGTNTIASGGTFEITGNGALRGAGAFHGPGTLSWAGGFIYETLNLLSDAVLSLNGSSDKTLLGNGTINNFGVAIWTGSGNLDFQAGTTFSNSGTFNAQNDALFYFSTGGSPVPVFNNTGIFRKTASTNATVIRGDNGGVTFNNSGLVDIQTGALSSQAQFNFNDGGTFSGTGVTSIDGSTGTMNGTSIILSGGNVFLANGQLNGTGAFTGPGNFNWTGGTVNGSVGTATGGNMLISGNGDKTIGGTLNNAGHAVWTGSGNVNIHASAICNNSGTFTAQNDGYFYFDTGGNPVPAFNNSGTFVKNTGTNATIFRSDNGGVNFNNTGSVNAQSGTIALAGGGTDANGIYNPSAGALITLPGSAHYFNGGMNFTGLGVTRVNGAFVILGGGTNTVQSNATFEIAGGTMAGTGAFKGAGTFGWTGGFITANLTMLSGSTLSLNGAGDKYLGSGGTINNLGTTIWTGTGNFFGQVGGVFNNTNLFLIQNDSVFYNDTGGSPNPVFNNYGTLRKTVATNTTTVLANNSPWVFNNSGVFDIQTGVLAFNTGANFNNGGTFSGAGKTQLANAASSLLGTNTIAGGGTFEIANSGALRGAGAFHGPGTLSWAGGSIYETLNLLSDAILSINGDSDKTLLGNGTINNFGTATWTGSGNFNVQAGTTFNNGGTFNAQNDNYFLFTTGGSPTPIFNNTGTFRKTIATGSTTFRGDNGGVELDNSGTVDLQTGTLAINAGYPPLSASVLKISLSGANQFSRETFPGNAPLIGTLQVALANGFIPTNGSSFDIVGYGSHSGQFTTIQLPPLPFGSAWRVDYNANAVTLRVVQPFVIGTEKKLANGHFQMTLNGPAANAAILQISTNLVQWVPIATNSPFTGSFQFDDHPPANLTNRFYEILILP